MPRAEPFRVWAAAATMPVARLRHCAHPLQQHLGLTVEELQDFALEAAVAERHAEQMLEVDRPLDRRQRRGRYRLDEAVEYSSIIATLSRGSHVPFNAPVWPGSDQSRVNVAAAAANAEPRSALMNAYRADGTAAEDSGAPGAGHRVCRRTGRRAAQRSGPIRPGMGSVNDDVKRP